MNQVVQTFGITKRFLLTEFNDRRRKSGGNSGEWVRSAEPAEKRPTDSTVSSPCTVDRIISGSFIQPRSTIDDFLRDFDEYLRFEEHESMGQDGLTEYLFYLGRDVKAGRKSWTEADVHSIVVWRRLHPLWKRIKEEPTNLERCLSVALAENDLRNRLDAMCRIPGFGPVLACAILTLTWPETYGTLDNPSWRALGLLNFDLPERPYCGGGFSVTDAVHYQTIIRTLSRIGHRNPAQVANALHAFSKTRKAAEISPSQRHIQEPARLVIENSKRKGAWPS